MSFRHVDGFVYLALQPVGYWNKIWDGKEWLFFFFFLSLPLSFITVSISHLDWKHNECHKDHDDHQELRGPDLRGDVSEAHGGEGDHAEVERVEQGQVVARSLEVLDAANADEKIRKGSGHYWDRDFTPQPGTYFTQRGIGARGGAKSTENCFSHLCLYVWLWTCGHGSECMLERLSWTLYIFKWIWVQLRALHNIIFFKDDDE